MFESLTVSIKQSFEDNKRTYLNTHVAKIWLLINGDIEVTIFKKKEVRLRFSRVFKNHQSF